MKNTSNPRPRVPSAATIIVHAAESTLAGARGQGRKTGWPFKLKLDRLPATCRRVRFDNGSSVYFSNNLPLSPSSLFCRSRE